MSAQPFDFAADPAALAAIVPRGRRPEFTGDPMVERLFSITLALTTELAVTRERLDTVERALARREVMPRDDVESFQPDATDRRERGELQAAYLARVFRALLQDQGNSAPVPVQEALPAAEPANAGDFATLNSRREG